MLPLPIITGLFEVGKQLIDRFFPDPGKKAEAQLKLLEMQQTGELAELAAATDLAKFQIQTNIEEAKSTNWFVAGWRPAIGWICGIAFGYTYILHPIFSALVFAFGSEIMIQHFSLLPKLDMGEMMPVLFGMLGLGAYRTYEKKNNAESNR